MKRTRLYERHVELGGRMVPFAGYELPVQYAAGPSAEHRSVRTAAGVFDIDHMGQFALSGEDALPFLQYVQVADVAPLGEWEARYSLLCYEDGTIVDDIFIYRLPERWLIVVNAANREKDFTWLQSFTHGYRVELTDISDETYMLAVQGPKATAILDRMSAADLAAAPPRSALLAEVGGVEMLLGRTGYTGEDGFRTLSACRQGGTFLGCATVGGARRTACCLVALPPAIVCVLKPACLFTAMKSTLQPAPMKRGSAGSSRCRSRPSWGATRC